MNGAGRLRGIRALNLMLAPGAGGVEAMALNVHRALESQGAGARTVGPPDSWIAKAFGESSDGFMALRVRSPFDPTAGWRLRSSPRAFAPNLAIAHGSRAVGRALAAWRGRLPIVAVVHNFWAKPYLAEVDLAICVSAAVEQDVRRRFPRLSVAMVENFAPLAAGPTRMRHNGPPRIVALGRLHRVKGFDVLLSAAAILRGRGIDFRLSLAGEGPERTALQGQIEALGLSGVAEMPGWLADPLPMLDAADLFVLSSRVETFGLGLIEAMARGAPVVASDTDGPRHILDGGRLGALVPPERPEALADAIAAALADPAAAEARARLAQTAALERYSLEAGARRLAAALERFSPP